MTSIDSPVRELGSLPLYATYAYDGSLYQVAGSTGTGLVQSYKLTGTPLVKAHSTPVVLEESALVEERKPSGEPLELFGLDCWGWQVKVAAVDADDARARAIAAGGDSIYAEMAETANVRLLADVPAGAAVHQS